MRSKKKKLDNQKYLGKLCFDFANIYYYLLDFFPILLVSGKFLFRFYTRAVRAAFTASTVPTSVARIIFRIVVEFLLEIGRVGTQAAEVAAAMLIP